MCTCNGPLLLPATWLLVLLALESPTSRLVGSPWGVYPTLTLSVLCPFFSCRDCSPIQCLHFWLIVYVHFALTCHKPASAQCFCQPFPLQDEYLVPSKHRRKHSEPLPQPVPCVMFLFQIELVFSALRTYAAPHA